MKAPNLTTFCSFKAITLFLIFNFSLSVQAQQPAFPTAYGGGANASGGRGGQVVHVTNLNDSGTGSLRWAIAQARPAIVVFDVSGTIDIQSWVDINGSDLTIAGQTAPIGGITIASTNGSRFRFRGSSGNTVNNIIIRYIRIKPATRTGADALEFFSDNGSAVTNVILDHVSVSYGGDEAISIRGTGENITFQRILIGESKTGSLFGDSDNGDLNQNNSYLFNLHFNVSHRHPNPGSNGRVDIINNVIHDWQYRLASTNHDIKLNHVNNYYSLGSRNSLYGGGTPTVDGSISGQTNVNTIDNRESNTEIYTAGNIADKGEFSDPLANNQSLWVYLDGGSQRTFAASRHFTNTQHALIGRPFNIMSATEAYNDVIANVGAIHSLNADGSVSDSRDVQDAFYLGIMEQGEGANYPYQMEGSIRSWFDEQMFVDFQASVSSVPVNTRPFDFYGLNPHIPEVWFLNNVPNGQDHNDIAPSGYTWLEEYFNGVDATSVSIGVESVAVTPSTAELQITETLQLTATFTPSNATNQSGVWASSNTDVATVNTDGVITAMALGTITITFTSNEGGFTDTSEITVFPQALIASAGIDQQICEGESTTLTASGGTNYVWSTGETSESIEVAPNTTTIYTVTVSDDNGQSEDASVTVTVNVIPVADAGEDQTICEGESATLTASGGASYLWSNGETTASIDISPSAETIYSVEVTSTTCSFTDSVTVFVDAAPNITVSDDIVIVDGESTTLAVNGSDNYQWSTGETTAFINVTPTITTTYIVTSLSLNGCSSSADVTVTIIPEVIADAGADTTICRDESVTLNATGGGSYLWNTGDITSELIVSPLITTTYTVTVEDDFGYNDTDSVTITVNETPDITVSEDSVIIDGESATLVAIGGENYQWGTGETTATINVTPNTTTTYTVISTAVGGCADIEQVTVTVIPEVIADAGQDATICSGETINLNASGGSTYLWNTGETTSDLAISPIISTTYTVTVEDDYGFTDTDSVTITVNETPDISVSNDIVIMDGESTTLTANGGDNYQWNTGETSASIIVSPTTTSIYIVSSLGGSDCEDTEEVTVTVIPELVANAGSDESICSGESITLNASGGVSYTWNTGDTGSQLLVSPTVTTTYSVTVEDSFGNSDIDSATIIVNETPNISVSNDVTIMDGESTTLIANNGNNYLWSTGETTASIIVSPTNTIIYTVNSLGSGGCEDTEEVTVTVIPEVIANAGVDSAICNGDSITLNASGGISYTWNTGDTGSQLIVSPNVTTTYTVTVEDDFGNSDNDSVTIVVNETPVITVSPNISIVVGESASLVVSGAQTYQWSTGETTSSIDVSPIQTTTYIVIATTNTCSIQAQVTVTVEGVFEASAGVDKRVCQNDIYEVVLTANQGDSYLWNTGETSQSITVSPLATSTYTVTVTQGAQADTDNVTVYVDPNPDVVILNGDSIDIMDGDFVTLSAAGANSYEWNNGATQPNIAVSPSVTTTYEVRGYVGDCYDEKQITVNVIPDVIADAGENVSICLDEIASLTASGGEEYVWSTGETTQTIQVSPSVTTEYTVTVFNAVDFDEDSVIVEINANCDEDSVEDPINVDPQDFAFDVFPNPASNVVNVKLSGSNILTNVYLYDITGKLIHRARISNEDLSNSSTTQIDISMLQSGLYYIKLVDIHRDISKKLIVN